MKQYVNGCNISVSFTANELTSKDYRYTLPDGYSINTMHITSTINISDINNASIRAETRLIFPVVNSKSPSSILLYINDLTKAASLKFTIEKFGQIPDPDYFKYPFNPILVTGDDGNKYNVIPSDQFE